MVKRQISETLLSLTGQYPVITVTGPRQSGKTTLVKSLFPDKPYHNLEDPDIREFAFNDPSAFIKKLPGGAVIDEIQRVPRLLSYIQSVVDETRSQGMFILTGSQNLDLISHVTQSLAGRTAILKLLPFTLAEVSRYKSAALSFNDIALNGFFPAVYEKKPAPTIYYRNYYETYVERDLRQLINVKDLHLFRVFMRLCAGRIGQLFNASGLANETGVSPATIKNWISILEASFILFLLEPFHENINKRVVKSRKIYFTDVGLAAYLLGIEDIKHVANHPSRGSLFENMVITELIKARYNKSLDHNLYFYRDSNDNEVDVLFNKGHQLTPVEIKSSATFHADFAKSLAYIKKIMPSRINNGFIVYSGDIEQAVKENKVLNYRNAHVIVE